MVDPQMAYLQIPVAPEDQPKTAITTPFGLFIFRRMPFGLRNASQTFQRFVDACIADLPFVRSYIDDILITRCNSSEHEKHLEQLFARLHQNGLHLKCSKCQFVQKKTTFLGFEITPEGFHPVQRKIEAVLAYKQPSTPRKLKRFLDMAGFYHRFIQNFSGAAAPLTDLLQNVNVKSNVPLQWDDAANSAFEKLKVALKDVMMLTYPQPTADLELTTDASGAAAGAVLHQLVKCIRMPLAFFLRKFTPLESNNPHLIEYCLPLSWH